MERSGILDRQRCDTTAMLQHLLLQDTKFYDLRFREGPGNLPINEDAAARVFHFVPVAAIRCAAFVLYRQDVRHGPAIHFENRTIRLDRQGEHEPLDRFVLRIDVDVFHCGNQGFHRDWRK